MISHDLSITGAQNCVFLAAKTLIQEGYHVIVGSPYDGILREDFLKIGATVIIDEHLRLGTIQEIDWIRDSDILFINTVQLYYLLLDRPANIPVIWWIHEPEILYKSVLPDLICKIEKENLRVYTVSKVAQEALNRYWKDIESHFLIYGIPDSEKTENKSKNSLNSKMRFVTIGAISKLKGYDILLNAISLLTKREQHNAEFLFIGKSDTTFSRVISDEIERLKLPVVIRGEMDNAKLLEMLDSADVLICPSRAETMSMAVTEGMMKKLVIIVSSSAGISDYILDGENGFVFQSENAVALSNKITYCLRNRGALSKIAAMGRETYLREFSLTVFEKRLKQIIHDERRRRDRND